MRTAGAPVGVAPAAAEPALAIDIGGTKVSAAVVDPSGALLSRRQTPTPRNTDAASVFAAVCAVADGALDDAGLGGDGAGDAALGEPAHAPAPVSGIGVATAGPLNVRTGTVSPVNIAAWRDYPLREALAERYGLPVRMFGDALAVTIAEHWRGAARGLSNVLGMVVSTGIGGGLILDGRVVAGAGGNAGHLGHMSIDPNGPSCPCGGVGCVEALASGTAIARWAAERTADRDEPLTTAQSVAEAARAGDAVAVEAFDRAGEALGLAIAGTVTLLDLDRVVIGGGVAQAWDLLEAPLARSYARYATLDYAAAPRVVTADLANDAGLLGAAAVVLHGAEYWPFAA